MTFFVAVSKQKILVAIDVTTKYMHMCARAYLSLYLSNLFDVLSNGWTYLRENRISEKYLRGMADMLR